MIYEGIKTKEISFPVGGIGSGCIGIAGNGALVDWEIFNRPNKNSENGYSHFAVRVFEDDEISDARILIGDNLKEFNGRVSGGFGNGANCFSMMGFPHFKKSVFNAEFPFAKLDFYDNKFPGKISLKTFNPIIPLDSNNSSIPSAFFEIEIENTTDKNLKYQVALSVQNPFNQTINKICYDNKGITLYDAEKEENNLTIITNGQETETMDYWYRGWWNNFYKDNIRNYWNIFSGGEKFKNREYDAPNTQDTATLLVSENIEAGTKKKIRFVLSWSIPKNYNYWSPFKNDNGNDITWTNYYATIFKSSFQSAEYSLKNWDELCKKTKKFSDAIYSCTLDDSMKQAISAALSVIKSPTILRLENGDLYGWEGVNEKTGSCEGICQHVWNYAYVLCYLFPDLEMSIRNNYLKYGTLENGETVFRLPLPFYRKQFVNLFDNNQTKFRACVDGQMGDVIKIYREWKMSGNTEWIKSHWNRIAKLVEFAWSKENKCNWDENKDGVLTGRQHHTLDIDIFGTSAWLQGFYLAALKAASCMAVEVGDDIRAKEFTKLYESGYEYTKNNLFNGDYFIQNVDIKNKSLIVSYNCDDIFWNKETQEINYQIGDGCIIDQIVAQWHADLCGLGNIFDDEQVKKALISIYKNNFKKSLRNFPNPWRLFAIGDEGGTIICSYPKGSNKPANPIAYSEEVMSGFEYAFAGLLLSNGFLAEAIEVVKAVRERYDGEKRNPFNDCECGSNYARSMAAFSFIPLSSGFVYDGVNNTMTLNPKIECDEFKSVWFTPFGWGDLKITNNNIYINVKSGYLKISSIRLPFIKDVISVEIDDKSCLFNFDRCTLYFNEMKIERSLDLNVKRES